MTDYKQFSGKTVHVIFGWNDICGRVMEVNGDSLYVRLFGIYKDWVKVRYDKIKHIEPINVKEDHEDGK